MKYSLLNIQTSIELKTNYKFELVKVLKQPVLKLMHLPDPFEIYVELNKGTKTIRPYVSVVSVDTSKNIISRNDELFDIDKIMMHLKHKLSTFEIEYQPIEKPIIYVQQSLTI